MNDRPTDDADGVAPERDDGRPKSGSRPSAYWEPPTLESLGAMLPQYGFLDLLGRGGMGAVYLARQLSLDRLVAIKVLPGDVFDDADATFVQRFQNEARTMGRMNHPGIVNVFDFGEAAAGAGQRLLYFVMEYVEGTDVAKMVLEQKRLDPAHALAITAHVCDALSYAHLHGVIHRDIKPANILINREGQVKVADFGLAKGADADGKLGMTRSDVALGTPDYVAPEALVLGMQSDHRGDLYAVGVMLYNMLTGEIPRGMFQLPSVKAGTDVRFDKIIVKAMQADRELRYQSAAEIRLALDEILTTPMAKMEEEPQVVVVEEEAAKARRPGHAVNRHSAPVQVGHRGTAPVQVMKSEEAEGGKRARVLPVLVLVPVLAIVGGVWWFKPEAKEEGSSAPEAEKVATAVSPPVPAPASKEVKDDPVAKRYPIGKWVGVFTKPEDVARYTQGENPAMRRDQDGWLRFAKYVELVPPEAVGSNWGFRGKFRKESKGLMELKLRATERECYGLRIRDGVASLIYHRRFDSKAMEGMNFPPPLKLDFLKEGEEFGVEFFVVGKRLVGRVANRYLGRAVDGEGRLVRGRVSTYGATPMSNMEVINLDGMEEGDALRLARVDRGGADLNPDAVPVGRPSDSPPTLAGNKTEFKGLPQGEWQKLFEMWNDLPAHLRPDSKSTMSSDGWLTTGQEFHLAPFKMRNGGIRAKFKSGVGEKPPVLRVRMDGAEDGGGYQLTLSERPQVHLIQRNQMPFSVSVEERSWPAERRSDGVIFFEFYGVGSRLIAKMNGKVVSLANNDRWPEGFVSLLPGATPVREVQVINLDGVPEEAALSKIGVDLKETGPLANASDSTPAVQAKVNDVISLPSECVDLRNRMEGLTAERVTGPYEEALKKLNAGYLSALEREEKNARQAGRLDDVLRLQSAIARVRENALQVLPEEDEAGLSEGKLKLRTAWRTAFQGISDARKTAEEALRTQYVAALSNLESLLTKQDRVKDALAVRALREEMGAKTEPATLVSMTTDAAINQGKAGGASSGATATATATTQESAEGEGEGVNRRAAMMILSKGGSFEALAGRETRKVREESELPSKGFQITALWLGSPENRSMLSHEEMEALKGLKEVVRVGIEHQAIEVEDLGVFATMPKLRDLSIRENPKMTDESLGVLAKCKEVDKLSIEGSRLITSKGVAQLAALKKLQYLSLGSCVLMDAGVLESLAQIRSLRLVGLHACPAVPAETIGKVASLPEIWQITFSGEQMGSGIDFKSAKTLKSCVYYGGNKDNLMSEVEMTSLMSAPGIQNYKLDGRMMNESQLARLASMQTLSGLGLQKITLPGSGLAGLRDSRLARLTLRDINVTDAMLADLVNMKSLRLLEIFSGTGLTKEGIEAFAKARRDVKIEQRQ
jgi:serine/threonine protein kinase